MANYNEEDSRNELEGVTGEARKPGVAKPVVNKPVNQDGSSPDGEQG